MPTVSVVLNGFILPWLNAFVIAFVPLAATVLASRAVAYLAQRNINTCWFEAISRAGGEAYKAFLLTGKPITDVAALQLASAAGAAYLAARVPEIVLKRGLDPAALAQIAGAELGKLLAADPTVKPGPVAVVPVLVPVAVPVAMPVVDLVEVYGGSTNSPKAVTNP